MSVWFGGADKPNFSSAPSDDIDFTEHPLTPVHLVPAEPDDTDW